MLKKLWVEAYRPSSVARVIFANEDHRAFFTRIVEEGSLPNLMLMGPPGTGKTSLSGALLNDLKVLPEDILRVNCSDDQIEKIRGDVKAFAYSMPQGAFKVVQLEELDYLSGNAQGLLRSLTEEVSGSCRFIATANYTNKVMPAMWSRFQDFTFSAPSRDQVLERAVEILTAEGVAFSLERDEDVDRLLKIVDAAYPDVRKVIQLLEACSKTGRLVIMGEGAAPDWKLQLLPLLEADDLKGARHLVCTAASKEELQDVYRFLYTNLARSKRLGTKWDQAVVLIADYQRWHDHVADAELHLAALFVELEAL